MLMHVINIGHDVLKANDELAKRNRKLLDKKGVLALNIMGAIGSGKTTLIEEAIQQLNDRYRIAVIAGDVVADMDAARFRKWDVTTVAANTGRECHLDAKLVEQSLTQVDLDATDIMFIENVGNLICPVDYRLGEHVRVVVVSVTEGDDIVLKHPMIFKTSDLAVVHKVDIAPAVSVNPATMERDILSLKPHIPVLLTSAHDGSGIGQWVDHITSYMKQ